MASAGKIQRINDSMVDRQFTAKDLIGKELYDNAGKRIGEVKDIVLASSVNPQLATGISSKSGASGSSGTSGSTGASTGSTSGTTTAGTTRSASANIGGVGATGSVNTSDSGVTASGSLGGTNTAGSSGSLGSDMARHASSMMGSMSESAVIVSYGGFLGAGNSLLRVPLSQLNYDASNQHITLNVAESELSSLPEASDMSRSAAE
jgi:hypothetical protein